MNKEELIMEAILKDEPQTLIFENSEEFLGFFGLDQELSFVDLPNENSKKNP